MKLSMFNNIINLQEGKTVIYNSLSGGVLRLDEEHFTHFTNYSKDPQYILPDKLEEALKQGHIILHDHVNEKAMLRYYELLSSNNLNTLSLTIAPTMACNFRCPYCYEKGKSYTTMSDETLTVLIKYINDQIKTGDIKTLAIAWYGGEPLLRFDLIKKIRYGLELGEVELKQIIVTNGYLLTETIAKELADMGVERAQITLDGPPEIHNKSRLYPDGRDTFTPIIENIQKACEYVPINIRVNVDKNTLYHADELLDYLDKYELQGKVNLYLAPIDNFHDSSCNSSVCYNRQEFSKEQLDFTKRNIYRGYFGLKFGGFSPTVCGATNMNSFVIDPNGDMFKCWEEISDVDSKVGNIFKGLLYNEAFEKWLDYNYLTDEECSDCTILPICKGGCPKRVVDSGIHLCNTSKYDLVEQIELANKLKPVSV